MLDEHRDEAFKTAAQRAMDNNGPFLTAILRDVNQLKTFRQLEIELHGGTLHLTVERILHLKIEFRPIKRRFARVYRVGDLVVFQHILQHRFGAVPHLNIAHELFCVAGAEIASERQVERAINPLEEC